VLWIFLVFGVGSNSPKCFGSSVCPSQVCDCFVGARGWVCCVLLGNLSPGHVCKIVIGLGASVGSTIVVYVSGGTHV
jgi:ABC-type uncharacterized transport system permease subunit